MKRFAIASALFALSTALAQTPASTQVVGEITELNSQSKLISLRTDKGETFSIQATDATVFRKVPAGATDLTKAVRVAMTEAGKGDRVVAIGTLAGAGKIDARSIIVMSRSDIAQKQQADQEEWRKRGIFGGVAAVDAAAKTFTVKAGMKTVVVQTATSTDFRRYSADSVKYSDAVPASLAEIKVGDQARVLGEKSADGASIQAERVISGFFRQIAATVNSVNAATGEVVIKDLDTKKTLAVRITAESTMRKLPPPMAAQLARRYQPGGGAPAGGPPPPAAKGPAPAGGGDVGQMLDRLPMMPLSELKAGDAIMLSSTLGSDPAKVTAVMLLAGVEPLLTASPNATRDIMGGWNVGGGGAPDGQ